MPVYTMLSARNPALLMLVLMGLMLFCVAVIMLFGNLGIIMLVGMAVLTVSLFTHPLVPFAMYFGALFFEDTTLPGLPVSVNQILAPIFFLSAIVYAVRGKTLAPRFKLLPILAIVTGYFVINGLMGLDLEAGMLYGRYAVIYLALSICLAVCLSSERAILALAWIIVLSSSMSAVDGIFEALEKDILGNFAGHWGGAVRIEGTAPNPIVYAWNLVYSFPFAFLLFSESKSRYARMLAVALGMLIIGVTFLTFNRQTYVVVAVVLALCAVLYAYKNRAFFVSLVIALGVVAAFTVLPMMVQRMLTVTNLSRDISFLERRDSFLMGKEMFKEYPLTGVGFGSYHVIWREFLPEDYSTYYVQYRGANRPKYMDMGFLSVLVETGIIGFILFTALVLTVLIVAIRFRREAIRHQDRFAQNLSSLVIVIMVFYILTSMIQDTFLYTRIWVLYGVAMLLTPKLLTLRNTAEPAALAEGLENEHHPA